MTEFMLYRRRWVVLAAFSIASFSNNWIWITWSPIAAKAADYWGVSIEAVDALSSIYFYAFLPICFLAMYLIVDVLGLSKGLWLAFGLNTLGATIRWLGMASYWWVYIGICLCAYTQASILSIPPMIAGKWFGAKERATATAIGVLSNQFGASVGLGSTIFINFYNPDGSLSEVVLGRYLFAQAFIATTGFVMLLIFMNVDEPPTAPNAAEAARRIRKQTSLVSSASESTHLLLSAADDDGRGMIREDSDSTVDLAVESNHSFKMSLIIAIKYGWSFALFYGLTVGTFYTIPPFFSQFEASWSPQESGWLGFLYEMTGVLGSYITGRVVDRYQNHGFMSRALILSCVVFWACFGFFRKSNQHWIVYLTTMGTGYCLAASSTLGFELGASITYPANEATVGAVMQFFAQLYSFLGVTVGGWTNADTNFIAIVWGGIALAASILLSISTESRRPPE